MKLRNSTNIKLYILEHIDQAKIFEYYGTKYGSGLTSHDIYLSITRNSYMIKNPLRLDSTPSFSFMRTVNGGIEKLIATDFGNNWFSGDCFHFAGIALALNSNNPRHFVKICKDIIANVSNDNSIIPTSVLPTVIKKEENVILIPYFRDFNRKDYNYWLRLGITKDNVLVNVLAVQSFEMVINGEIRLRYYYSYNDPCYAYNLGIFNNINRYKLYFPFRKGDNAIRFITNNKYNIDDLIKMKPTQVVVFIKSIKDRILLTQILNEYYCSDIQVIAVSSESIKFSNDELNVINKLYKQRYCLFDNDVAGINAMVIMNKEYNITPLYLIHSIKTLYPEFIPSNILHEPVIIHKDIPKDLTDFCKKYGYDTTKEIVKHLLEKI